MITLDDYWMGRDKIFANELTPALRANAEDLLRRVNALLAEFGETRQVVSGWRPPAVNAAIHGSAVRSKHMTCQAVDLSDPDGDLDEWCMEHQHILARPDIDLYLEHPSATKNWCHLQTVPPKSQAGYPPEQRRRWFYP